MEEKILVKSKMGVNWILVFAAVYFLGGMLIFGGESDSILGFFDYCIYLWDPSFYILWPSVILIIVGVVLSGSELIVTDKRVYGRVNFLKRVDLPLDSVAAIGTCWLNGIFVSTSAGKISFLMVKNVKEIHSCLSELILQRQNDSVNENRANNTEKNSIEELKQLKELLESGFITQEEFDAKKKQLLGL